jgi:hypothetical protein
VNPLAWQVIAGVVYPGKWDDIHSYGNDVAVKCPRTRAQHDYPAGSVLSLVTRTQREDPRWFGAKIPGQVKSAEFVTVGAAGNGGPRYAYEAYTSKPLRRT